MKAQKSNPQIDRPRRISNRMNLAKQTAGLMLALGGLIWGTALPGYCLSQPLAFQATATLVKKGGWTFTGSLGKARHNHTATLLNSGKVLVVGGHDASGDPHNSAELYDPETQGWSATGALNASSSWHTATLLSNGKVLVAGGYSGSGPIDSAELYDPATATWVVTVRLVADRFGHTATLLENGKVLVAGGHSSGNLQSAQLYETVATGTPKIFSATVTGKKLFVTGEGFDPGAVILLNGAKQKTRNEDQDSRTELVGKQAGKKIRTGDRLQVRNPDGTLSEEFTFTASERSRI